MLYGLGRFLQLLGLLMLPAAIAGELADKIDLKTSLAFSSSGIVIFVIGWLIQRRARPG